MWSSSRCLSLPLMPAPPFLSALILSHPTTYSLPYVSHPSLSFIPPLMMSTPHLLYPSLSISLSLIHLPFLYSLPMLSPILLFWPFSFLFLLLSSCRPPASSGSSCLSSVFAHYISSLFLWGEFCVCSPPYCVI